MTNEEAVRELKILKAESTTKLTENALDFAIKALTYNAKVEKYSSELAMAYAERKHDEEYLKELEERDADAYETGYLQGHIEGYQKAEKDYARPIGEWIDEGQYAEGHSEHAYLCKNCGYQIIELPNMIFENRFCKYCGADMQKGGAE